MAEPGQEHQLHPDFEDDTPHSSAWDTDLQGRMSDMRRAMTLPIPNLQECF